MRRTYIAPGRLIVSRPGFEAGPQLPEDGKAFDSDWGFTGTLIASGTYVDPPSIPRGPVTIPIALPFGVREVVMIHRHVATSFSYINSGGGTTTVNRPFINLGVNTRPAIWNGAAFVIDRNADGQRLWFHWMVFSV